MYCLLRFTGRKAVVQRHKLILAPNDTGSLGVYNSNEFTPFHIEVMESLICSRSLGLELNTRGPPTWAPSVVVVGSLLCLEWQGFGRWHPALLPGGSWLVPGNGGIPVPRLLWAKWTVFHGLQASRSQPAGGCYHSMELSLCAVLT